MFLQTEVVKIYHVLCHILKIRVQTEKLGVHFDICAEALTVLLVSVCPQTVLPWSLIE